MDDVNFAEARDWIVLLHTFTVSELADCMLIDHAVAQRYVFAAEFWGIIENTKDYVNGTEAGYEALYSYVPLPPGPRFHPHRSPEWLSTPGCYSLAPRRGMPVRLRNERELRRTLSTPGARAKEKQRDNRYKKMMEKVQARKEAHKIKETRPKAMTSGKRKAMAMADARARKRIEKHKGRMFE